MLTFFITCIIIYSNYLIRKGGVMMKEQYTKPVVEKEEFVTVDVYTISFSDGSDD